MNSALAFLIIRSVIGRVTRMARRLREPRYALGFLVGGAWTVFWLSRLSFAGERDVEFNYGIPPELLQSVGEPIAQAIQLGIALAFAVGLTLWWLIPLGRSSLELSEAELHLLLPAPISRRSIIQYGILRSQPGVLLSAAIVSFFTGADPVRFIGLWLFFTIWDLHGKARGLWFTRQRASSRPVAWRRRLTLYGGLAAFWAGLAIALVTFFARVIATFPSDFDDVFTVIEGLLETHVAAAWDGVIGWLLTPLVLVVRPYLLDLIRPGWPGWALAWAVPIAVLVLHNEWVVRSQAGFEEAELASARRRSRKTDPSARFWKLSERRRAWRPFELGAAGRPELALVWKNLMLVHRMPLRLLALTVGGGIAVLVIATRLLAVPPWMIGILEIAGGLLLVIPPLLTGRSLRNDLRNDLLHLETIRTWPLEGWRLFLAQTGAPFLLTLLQMSVGAALVIGLDLSGLTSATGGPAARSGIADALSVPSFAAIPLLVLTWAPMGAAIALLTIALENLAALTFPSWVHLGMNKKQAAANFGQNLLVFFVLSLALLAGLAPGAIAVALVLAAQILVWGQPFSGWELPLLGLIAAIPTLVVAGALVRGGGSIWDRLDPAQELLEGRL